MRTGIGESPIGRYSASLVFLYKINLPTNVQVRKPRAPGEAAPIIVELLVSVPAADPPGKMLLPVALAPGASAPALHHPGQLLVAIDFGTVTCTALGREGQSARTGCGMPTTAEVLPPGAQVALGPGDWPVEDPGLEHTMRHAGHESAVLLLSAPVAAEQPLLQSLEIDMTTIAAKSRPSGERELTAGSRDAAADPGQSLLNGPS